MADDYVEIELRPAAEVAERSIILAALIRRLWIETSSTSSNAENWTAEAFDLREWLRTEGVWNILTPSEADVLERSVGAITEDELAAVAWQAEGLATLGWALGLADLLPPGELGDITTVVQTIPAPWDSTSPWRKAARLRSEAEIARERDRAEILEWRIGIESPRRLATAEERVDYDAALADVIGEARASGLLEAAGGTDFTVGGRLLTAFNEQDLERLGALAEERLRALNWLCGYGASWETVPLEI